jgi:membrane fusion protein, multidrug efflux system
MHFALPPQQGAVHVPATALMFREQGMMVATVGPDSRVRLKVVAIRRDMGNVVEVGSGLTLDDRVIDNPPDAIREGDLVKVQSDTNT